MKPRGNTCDVRPESGPTNLDTVRGKNLSNDVDYNYSNKRRTEETEARERVPPLLSLSLSLTVDLVKETGHMCFWLQPEALPTFSRMMKIKSGKRVFKVLCNAKLTQYFLSIICFTRLSLSPTDVL